MLAASGSVRGVCCNALHALLGSQISFPGSATYDNSMASYFSAQEGSVQPDCVLSPNTPSDISAALEILAKKGSTWDDAEAQTCQFAVRSGGHAMFAGAANIAGGVTVDLRGLKSVTLSDDQSTVSVGPGATWDMVYQKLDGLGLSVAGGRAAGVGVGGLSLGGGISFFSPRYGWTCDSISGAQVVLANGSIVEANSQDHSDLLVALRGGSNNFGVVSRLDFKTFEQSQLWGGVIAYPISTAGDQIEEFVKLNSADEYDEFASLNVGFGYTSATGPAIISQLVYTKAVADPPVFQGFLNLPSLYSTVRLTNMSEIAQETAALQVHGQRQLNLETTLISTTSVLTNAFSIFNESISAITGIEGIVWSLVFETMPPAVYARHANSNSLGLSNRTESLVVALIVGTWANETDDKLVIDAANALLACIESNAQSDRGWDPYVYLNYAGKDQDPLRSYGSESLGHLQQVRDKYDPEKVFTYGVPGGFKIPA